MPSRLCGIFDGLNASCNICTRIGCLLFSGHGHTSAKCSRNNWQQRQLTKITHFTGRKTALTLLTFDPYSMALNQQYSYIHSVVVGCGAGQVAAMPRFWCDRRLVFLDQTLRCRDVVEYQACLPLKNSLYCC